MLDVDTPPDHPAGRVREQVAAAYDRTVAPDSRARPESTTGLLRSLAVTGGSGLLAAREHRVAVIAAAEELRDAELTAPGERRLRRPAIWTRLDDPEQAAHVVAAAERTLAALPSTKPPASPEQGAVSTGHEAAEARLPATIALESRGTSSAPALGDRETMARAHSALAPAANEPAGAGSGLLTVGPVPVHLADLATALGQG